MSVLVEVTQRLRLTTFKDTYVLKVITVQQALQHHLVARLATSRVKLDKQIVPYVWQAKCVMKLICQFLYHVKKVSRLKVFNALKVISADS